MSLAVVGAFRFDSVFLKTAFAIPRDTDLLKALRPLAMKSAGLIRPCSGDGASLARVVRDSNDAASIAVLSNDDRR